MACERRVLTVGGKGSSLSPSAVFEFAIASPPQLLRTDPSALSRLSSSTSGLKQNLAAAPCRLQQSVPDFVGEKGPSPSPAFYIKIPVDSPPQLVKVDRPALASINPKQNSASGPSRIQLSVPDFLTREEARASIILMCKHLLGGWSPSSSSAGSKLLDILSNDTQNLTIDLDFDGNEDINKLRGSWPVSTLKGICALLDHAASSLATVADAVAALSCEALKADTCTAFSVMDSGDGFSNKDMAIVSSDLKVLLKGSKSCGNLRCDQVDSIPMVHGRLRSLYKSVHSSTRIALNSTPLVNASVGPDLTALFSSLGHALENLGESSWHRANLCLTGLEKDNLFPILVDSFNAGCPGLGKLKDSIKAAVILRSEGKYVQSLHEIYILAQAVTKILSWEATISFISLEGSNKGKKGVDGGNDVKKDKKNKVLGKGTSVLMHFIHDKLQSVTSNATDSSTLPEKVAQGFVSFLDFKDPDFESLVRKLKQVVDSNESRRLPKLPKGTRDFAKEQMAIRERAFAIVGNVFKMHGALALDTPAFELRETLTGKYGEDSKLIYDLADQGGELCSLRYDLTVPFARYVAMNGLTYFKRYQIAKVHRRDNPSKSRLREFYQCDFDIAGDETVAADFEAVRVLVELLDDLNIGDYEIKLSHRKLLDGMLEICGVPSHKMRTICSSIDKFDKQSFDQIKKEMIEEKGLDAETVDNIGQYVCLRGPPLKLLSQLKNETSEFLKNDASSQALKDLEKLFNCLDKRCLDKVVLDLSLARGLDYYTGVIFEAVSKGALQVGSIGGGGRYDNLIGTFGTKRVAAVGVSLGIERVFTLMEQLQKVENQVIRPSETQVLVSILGDDVALASKLVQLCWDAKLKAEFMANKRLNKHFDRAKEFGIPWVVIVGEREINEGIVKIKNKEAKLEQEVAMSGFVDELITLMRSTN